MGVRKSVYHVGIKTAQRCGIFVTICMSDMYFKRIAAFIRAEAIRPPHGIAYLKIKKYLAGEASCHGEGYPPYSPFLFCCLQVFSACVYSTAVCPCRGINYVNKHILLPLEGCQGSMRVLRRLSVRCCGVTVSGGRTSADRADRL